jgi:hypothetical protein
VEGLVTYAALVQRNFVILVLKMVAAIVLVHMLLRFVVPAKGWSRVFLLVAGSFLAALVNYEQPVFSTLVVFC